MEMTRENIQNLFSLKGKRALIIGGAGGIGLAIAKAYVMVGADVVMADKNEELLGQSQALLQAENLSMTTQVVDITDVESVSSLGTYIKETGGVDILVNSAAITEREPVLEMDVETWASIIDVNLHGSYYVAKEFGAIMRDRGRGGRMVFINSTGAYRASVNFGAYSASKAGLTMLCKTLALEFAPYGILVNSIAATATDTNFTASYYQENPERRMAVIANHPLGRLAQPEDYVGAAIYLASEASAFVTGAMLVVDGGKTAR